VRWLNVEAWKATAVVKKTFVDSGVLIAAARGSDEVALRAMEILDDPERTFASSAFVRLEVLPKALYHRNAAAAEFYEAFFSSVKDWAEPVERVTRDAHQEAVQSGLSALDALNVASAAAVGPMSLSLPRSQPDLSIELHPYRSFQSGPRLKRSAFS